MAKSYEVEARCNFCGRKQHCIEAPLLDPPEWWIRICHTCLDTAFNTGDNRRTKSISQLAERIEAQRQIIHEASQALDEIASELVDANVTGNWPIEEDIG